MGFVLLVPIGFGAPRVFEIELLENTVAQNQTRKKPSKKIQ